MYEARKRRSHSRGLRNESRESRGAPDQTTLRTIRCFLASQYVADGGVTLGARVRSALRARVACHDVSHQVLGPETVLLGAPQSPGADGGVTDPRRQASQSRDGDVDFGLGMAPNRGEELVPARDAGVRLGLEIQKMRAKPGRKRVQVLVRLQGLGLRVHAHFHLSSDAPNHVGH